MIRHLLLLALAIIALSGCTDEVAEPAANPAEVAPATTVEAFEPTPSQRAFIEALVGSNTIDTFALSPAQVARYGANTCLDLKQGKTADEVRDNTQFRFDTTRVKAEQIVIAAQQHLCPDES